MGIIQKSKGDIVSVLKAEKEELESSLSKEKLHTLQLKQELAEAESRNSDLYKVTTFIVEIPFLFWISQEWIQANTRGAKIIIFLIIMTIKN